jgi:hypothetical protein
LEILGHTISAAGAVPTPITPLKSNFAHPLRTSSSYNFFSAFLSKCAQVLHPLTDLLKGEAKKLE